MKILFAVLLSFLCLVGKVEGALKKNVVDPISTNSIGSMEAVIRHCLISGRYLDVTVGQGNMYVGAYNSLDLQFKTLEELNAFIGVKLLEAIQGAITNEFGQNRSLPFNVRISWAAFDLDSQGSVLYLSHESNITLKKISGSYTAPDISGIKIGLPDYIPYKTTNMVWGKIICSDLRTGESRSDSVVYVQEKFLAIPQDIATDSFNFKTDIRVLDQNYNLFIYDGHGNRVPEKEPTLQIFGSSETLGSLAVKNVGRTTSNPNTVSLMVNGGEVGRTYQIQCSDSVVGNWVNVGSEVAPNRVDDPGTISYSEPVQSGGKFFRVITLKKIPYLP